MIRTPTLLLAAAFAVLVSLGAGVAQADSMSSSGTFKGASNHVTSGGATVVTTANGGAIVILDSDFSFDGAPDPRVGLGKDGSYDKSSDLGELNSSNGLQAYVVPANVDVSNYNEVYIWCRKYSVPLGVASVK